MSHAVTALREQPRGGPKSWLAASLLAALLGLLAGGAVGLVRRGTQTELSPRAIVARALAGDPALPLPSDWETLAPALNGLVAQQGDAARVVELLASVHGLTRQGNPDWSAAEAACKRLNWQRCDRPMLEALRERSRP